MLFFIDDAFLDYSDVYTMTNLDDLRMKYTITFNKH
jgi:hypothetical protein